MPNDYRDRSRFGSDDDRDYGRDRYSRGEESHGMFGYEGEGYMRGGSRDVERDFEAGRGEFGHERGGRYNTGFSGGGYGTGERYGTGGSGRGAYGGGGYGEGGGGSFGSRGGFSGVDRSEFGTGYSDRGSGRGGEMAGGGYRGPRPAGYSGGGVFDRGSSDRGFDRDFRFNAYGDLNRGAATDFDHGTTNEQHRGGGMMNRIRQSFRGRGPKGYQRSDERIREDVCERLAMDHDVDATDIEVRVSGGTVTLSGTAPDRDTKRRAEDVAESVSGVHDVENEIRVAREGRE